MNVPLKINRRSALLGAAGIAAAAPARFADAAVPSAASNAYVATNLVSNGAVSAAHTDVHLRNSWGVAFNPFGVGVSTAITVVFTEQRSGSEPACGG